MTNWRFKIIRLIYIFLFLAIALRLGYWQIIRFEELSSRAEKQHLKSYAIEARRGQILSSDGYVYVGNKPVYLMYGLPKIIKDKEGVVATLSRTMMELTKDDQLSKTDYRKYKESLKVKLSQDLYWVILAKNITLDEKNEIEKLKLEGIGFEESSVRFYPESSSAAHLLGFVGENELGNPTGYFGVEGYYNRELKGVPGELIEEKDALGNPILTGKFYKKEPKSGRDLVLNIDRTVQYIAEKKLKKGVEKYGAKSGTVIIMEPSTGAILAIAAFPSYDPSSYSKYPKEFYKNPAVSESYEPGSTFKVLIMAAGLNEKKIKPETKCDNCSGPVRLGGFYIRTWNNKYYPETTMAEALAHSDNTGMVFVSKQLGHDLTYQYIENYGFGNLTQIDLQDETSPSLRAIDEWKEIDLATSSFGQGVAITPLQLIRAVAAIANGGRLMEPHIVKAIIDHGKQIEIKPKIVSQVISEETAIEMKEMMVNAVEQGEAKALVPKGYKVAGKTGTAQIPVAGHYDPEKTVASFIGFAPADNPKFVMLVKYNEPSSSVFGAETAVPTFFEIAKELLVYYNLPPR